MPSDFPNLFTCPACRGLLRISAPARKYGCPHCGQPFRLPQSHTVLSSADRTALAEPLATVALDAERLTRLRVWAAAIRDREGDQQDARGEVVSLAKTLCELLDMRTGLQAQNARHALDGNVALLVGLLILSGVRSPGQQG
jgi:hypothetical protein